MIIKQRQMIIFEGISGSGKSTLEDMYREANSYHDYTMHRFTPSKYAYAQLYHRPIDVDKLINDELKMRRAWRTKLIYLTCDPKIALERKQQMGDTNIEKSLDQAKLHFEHYIINASALTDNIWIDTDLRKPEYCLQMILNFCKLP